MAKTPLFAIGFEPGATLPRVGSKNIHLMGDFRACKAGILDSALAAPRNEELHRLGIRLAAGGRVIDACPDADRGPTEEPLLGLVAEADLQPYTACLGGFD